jgi:hypothetical protein
VERDDENTRYNDDFSLVQEKHNCSFWKVERDSILASSVVTRKLFVILVHICAFARIMNGIRPETLTTKGGALLFHWSIDVMAHDFPRLCI